MNQRMQEMLCHRTIIMISMQGQNILYQPHDAVVIHELGADNNKKHVISFWLLTVI